MADETRKILLQIDVDADDLKRLGLEARREFEKLTDSRKELQEQQKKNGVLSDKEIIQLNKLDEQIKQTRREMNLYNKELGTTGGSLDRQRAQLSRLNREYDKFVVGVTGSKRELKDLENRINGLTSDIKQQEFATQRFQRNVGNYTQSIKQAFTGIGDAITGGLITGGVIAGVNALTRLIGNSVEIFREFELEMSKVRAVSGATEEQFASLQAEARRLGASTEKTATEVGSLQLELSKLGFTAEETLNATEAILNLSTATQEDLAKSAEVAGATIRAFNLDARDTADVTNVMAKAFSTSALNLEDFSVGMRQVAPVAAAFGFSVRDTTSILGLFANAGFDASQSGTALRNILLNLADTDGKLAKELGRSVTNVDELIPALKELSDRGIDLAGTLELTDKRSVAAFNRLLSGTEDLKVLRAALNDTNGAAEQMANTIRDTLSGDVDSLNSAFQEMAITFSEGINPALRAGTKLLTTFVRAGTSGALFGVGPEAQGLTFAEALTGQRRAGTQGLPNIPLPEVMPGNTDPLGLGGLFREQDANKESPAVKTLKELNEELSKLKNNFTGAADEAQAIKLLQREIDVLNAKIEKPKKANLTEIRNRFKVETIELERELIKQQSAADKILKDSQDAFINGTLAEGSVNLVARLNELAQQGIEIDTAATEAKIANIKRKELAAIESEERLLEIEKTKELAIKTGYDVAESLADTVFQNEIDRTRAKQSALQEQLNQGIISQQQYNTQKLALDKKLGNQEKTIGLKRFLIDFAIAITKAIAAAPPPINLGLIAAQSALLAGPQQLLSLIKFADGGQAGLASGPSHANGGIKAWFGNQFAEYEGGEYITNKRATSNNLAALQAINSYGDRFIFDVIPRLRKFADGGLTSRAVESRASARFAAERGPDLSQLPLVVTVEDINKGQQRVRVVQNLANA